MIFMMITEPNWYPDKVPLEIQNSPGQHPPLFFD